MMRAEAHVRIVISATAALIIIGTAPAGAQDEVTSARLGMGIIAPVPSAQTPAQGPAPGGINAGPLRNLKFSGLVQTWYQAGDEGVVDTFRIRRAELYVSGDLTSFAKFQVMIDPSKSLALNSNSTMVDGTAALTGASVNQAGRILQDAYIRVKVAPHVDIQVGQFKVPLNMEGLASSYALALVERSLITTDGSRGGAFGDKRDIGAMASGTFSSGFEYRVGVFDGLGSNQNDVDKDDHKAVAGRLAWQTPVKGLKVGGFGAADREEAGNLRRTRTGLDVGFTGGSLLLQAEYVAGQDGALDRRGYYLTAGYKVSAKAEIVARLDTWDPDTNADTTVGNVLERDYNVGFTYYVSGNNVKCQVEYLHKTFAEDIARSRNIVLSHLQVTW
jgi:hypothetical protein